MATLEEITQILQITLVGDTEGIREAQKQLKLLHSQPYFLFNLLSIPKDRNIPYNIRKAAVLYVNTFVNSINIQNNYELLSNYCQQIFNSFLSESIQIKLKKHFITPLIFLISSDKFGSIKSYLYDACSIQCRLICDKISSTEANKFIGIAFGVQTVLLANIHNSKQLNLFLKNSFINFINAGNYLCSKATEAIKRDIKSTEQLLELFEIIKLYSCDFKLYLKKISYSQLQVVKILFQPEFCRLFEDMWELNLDMNNSNSKLFCCSRLCDPETLQLFHSIKADYMQGFTISIRILFQYFKDKATLFSHPIIKNTAFFQYIISSLNRLVLITPYYKIQSPSLLKLIEQSLNCLILIIKSNQYPELFNSRNKELIMGFLFKLFELSTEDLIKFSCDPEQIINEIMQIIDMDPTSFLDNRKKQFDITDQSEDVENYTTLKIVSATLLFYFVRNVDGILNQLLSYIHSNLIKENVEYSIKNMLLLVLGILRDLIFPNQANFNSIIAFVTKILRQSAIPEPIKDIYNDRIIEKQENFMYMMCLLILQKYINKQKNLDPNILPTLEPIILQIINRNKVEIGLKVLAFEMITTICGRDDDNVYVAKFLMVCQKSLNLWSNSTKVEQKDEEMMEDICMIDSYDRGKKQCETGGERNISKILDTIFNILKMKGGQLTMSINIVKSILITVKNVIEKQSKIKQMGDKDIIAKSWNIISDICSNQNIVELIGQQIQECLGGLALMTLENLDISFDDDFLLCINSLVQIRQSFNINLVSVFNIIGELFYGKYHFQFYQAYNTLNLILKYERNLFEQRLDIIQKLIQICIIRIEKIEIRSRQTKCQGILLLENIIIYCSKNFTSQLWYQLCHKINSWSSSINENTNKTFIANVYASLTLILFFGYGHMTTVDKNYLFLIIKNCKAFIRDKHSIKILVIMLCNLFYEYHQETNIFEFIIDLLKIKEEQEDEQYYEKQYFEQVQKIRNMICQLDELNYFKQMIGKLKKNKIEVLQRIKKELPEGKLRFTNQMLSTLKINNQSRQIFKIRS